MSSPGIPGRFPIGLERQAEGVMPEGTTFIFIADPVDFAFCGDQELLPDVSIGRPSIPEKRLIQEWLDGLTQPLSRRLRTSFEIEGAGVSADAGGAQAGHERYAVIRLTGDAAAPGPANWLQLVASLLPTDLQFAAWFDCVDGLTFAYCMSGAHFQDYARRHIVRSPDVKRLTLDDVVSFADLHRLLYYAHKEYPGIFTVVEMLQDLHELPDSSPYQILGLFAIIEALITHRPRQTEPGDSICRQLSEKVPKVLARATGQPTSLEYFGDMDLRVLWLRLYESRSCLAHGRVFSWEKEFPDATDQVVASKVPFARVTTPAYSGHSDRLIRRIPITDSAHSVHSSERSDVLPLFTLSAGGRSHPITA